MTTRITSRLIAGCLLVFALAAFVGVRLSAQHAPANKALKSTAAAKGQLVVHEWGTFTSIAGRDGVALDWRPLNGPSDLPKFVHTMQEGSGGLRDSRVRAKATMSRGFGWRRLSFIFMPQARWKFPSKLISRRARLPNGIRRRARPAQALIGEN